MNCFDWLFFCVLFLCLLIIFDQVPEIVMATLLGGSFFYSYKFSWALFWDVLNYLETVWYFGPFMIFLAYQSSLREITSYYWAELWSILISAHELWFFQLSGEMTQYSYPCECQTMSSSLRLLFFILQGLPACTCQSVLCWVRGGDVLHAFLWVALFSSLLCPEIQPSCTEKKLNFFSVQEVFWDPLRIFFLHNHLETLNAASWEHPEINLFISCLLRIIVFCCMMSDCIHLGHMWKSPSITFYPRYLLSGSLVDLSNSEERTSWWSFPKKKKFLYSVPTLPAPFGP